MQHTHTVTVICKIKKTHTHEYIGRVSERWWQLKYLSQHWCSLSVSFPNHRLITIIVNIWHTVNDRAYEPKELNQQQTQSVSTHASQHTLGSTRERSQLTIRVTCDVDRGTYWVCCDGVSVLWLWAYIYDNLHMTRLNRKVSLMRK